MSLGCQTMVDYVFIRMRREWIEMEEVHSVFEETVLSKVVREKEIYWVEIMWKGLKDCL